MTDTISMAGISAASITLLNEDVLVRAAPRSEVSASGLVIPNSVRESFGRGSEFYGVVVAMGPGRIVERGPSPGRIRDFTHHLLVQRVVGEALNEEWAEGVGEEVATFVREHTTVTRVPLAGVKVGDAVLCRQGFGPEVELREGKHHIVGRGNMDHGHGVIAAWDTAHIHCWHRAPRRDRVDREAVAHCQCGAKEKALDTRLPACSSCPPGERLAEAVLAAPTYSYKIGSGVGAGHYEERPQVDDGRNGK